MSKLVILDGTGHGGGLLVQLKRSLILPIIFFIILCSSCGDVPDEAMDAVTYQGRTFRLHKTYAGYDEYKNDPNNIPSNELGGIEKLMLNLEPPKTFSSRAEMLRAVFALQFPGYGLTALGETAQKDGTTVAGFAIEIPQRDKDRYFIYQQTAGAYKLVDDFVLGPGSQPVCNIVPHNKHFTYYDFHGNIVREKNI